MTETRRPAVITHGAKLDAVQFAALRANIEAASARGLPAPEWWLETSQDDPGAGVTGRALREGAELVIVAGGDGTVSSCAATLAGTGVPLGIVPSGTGTGNRDRGVTTSITLGGARYERHGVRALVVGNVGRLPASIALLPDATPDSGTLDLVVLAPSGIPDWLWVAGRLPARRRPSVRGLERFRARHISIRTRQPVEREIDGEPIGAGDALDIEVEPAALVVRVARAAEPSADRPRAA